MPKCKKCGRKTNRHEGSACNACVAKYNLCPHCRADTDMTVKHKVYCKKCGKFVKLIESSKSKYQSAEFHTLRYLGKGKLTVNGIPYKIRTVYYYKKEKVDTLGAGAKKHRIDDTILRIKSVSGKFIAKRRRFMLLDLNPRIEYKKKSFRIAELKLEPMVIEHEERSKGSKSRRSRRHH